MTQTAPTSVVNALADRFWEGILHLNPTLATVYGDERYDDRLPDPGPAGRAAGRELCTTTLRAAEAIPETGLSVEERITRDMLTVACELRLTELDQRWEILESVDQMAGPQTLLPDIATFQRADTPERLERFLARVAAYPAYIGAISDLVEICGR